MLEVAASGFGLLALVGLAMTISATISRIVARVLRTRDETLEDPWMRRNDPLTRAHHWMKPGLLLFITAGTVALLVESVS